MDVRECADVDSFDALGALTALEGTSELLDEIASLLEQRVVDSGCVWSEPTDDGYALVEACSGADGFEATRSTVAESTYNTLTLAAADPFGESWTSLSVSWHAETSESTSWHGGSDSVSVEWTGALLDLVPNGWIFASSGGSSSSFESSAGSSWRSSWCDFSSSGTSTTHSGSQWLRALNDDVLVVEQIDSCLLEGYFWDGGQVGWFNGAYVGAVSRDGTRFAIDVRDVDLDGFVDAFDCDETDPVVNCCGEEVPNDGIDNDCEDGDFVDADGDGWDEVHDCDDADPAVHSGAADDDCRLIDYDCDGLSIAGRLFACPPTREPTPPPASIRVEPLQVRPAPAAEPAEHSSGGCATVASPPVGLTALALALLRRRNRPRQHVEYPRDERRTP